MQHHNPEIESQPILVRPQPCELGPEVFHRAVEILTATLGVTESLAYDILVQDAVQAGTTVRESATAIIAASLETP